MPFAGDFHGDNIDDPHLRAPHVVSAKIVSELRAESGWQRR
jgi:hypothetical protein